MFRRCGGRSLIAIQCGHAGLQVFVRRVSSYRSHRIAFEHKVSNNITPGKRGGRTLHSVPAVWITQQAW